MLIKQNKEENRRLKTKLYNLIIKFVYKYLLKLYDRELESHNTRETKPKLYRDFQKTLLQITKWSDKTIQKQTNKFLKWVEKRENLSEKDLQNMIKNIIKLSTQLILDKSDIYITTLLQNFNFPNVKTYYYKCLKRIARLVYENPKGLHDLQTGRLFDELDNILQSFLPLHEIEAILEFDDTKQAKSDETKRINVKYDFENDSLSNNSNSSISLRRSDQPKLIVDKQSSDPSLNYVSSEDLNFEEESENDLSKIAHKKPIDIINSKNVMEEGVKHIRVPKFKRSKYFYNKPKIDEINEYFFNE
jgi:hypothetical protein